MLITAEKKDLKMKIKILRQEITQLKKNILLHTNDLQIA